MNYLLSLLAVIGIVQPVTAHPVISALQQRGAEVRTYGPHCTENKWLGSYNYLTNVLTLCLDNHSDAEELRDTIRHEAIHHIQGCVGRQLIYRQDWIKSQASLDQLSKAAGNPYELEAYVIASITTDDDIIWLLEKFCPRNHDQLSSN